MATRIRRHGGNGLDAWPGYVDALSTLLMVFIFVLLVFVLSQAFLSATLTGRNEALEDAKRRLGDLTSALALERDRTAELQANVARLDRDLGAANDVRSTLTRQLAALQDQANRISGERDQLTAQLADVKSALSASTLANQQTAARLAETETKADSAREDAAAKATQLAETQRALQDAQAQLEAARRQLADMQRQIASFDQTVRTDKATIEAKLSDLARLTEQARALVALREELERRVKDTAARATTEAERRRALEATLAEQTQLGETARAEVARLTQEIEQLRAQLASVATALDLEERKGREKEATIADLDRRLNAALVDKVEELKRYRSDFFGRLRTLLENRSGIQIVGDRFVFQSEVLFPVGSADLTPAGIGQMTTLAITIKEIAAEIPHDVPWILRVDGHTDPQPVKGGQFASNWELSAARAITVVKMLIAAGVPAEHLAATGFGEYQPLGPRDAPDAYARDRRIELRLTDR